MGLFDRLAGANSGNIFVEMHCYAYKDAVRVVWVDNKPSPKLEKTVTGFAKNRQFMVGRMFLATIFYGTMLRMLGEGSDQKEFRGASRDMAAALREGDSQDPIWQSIKFTDSPSTQLTDHYHSVLFQGRGGHLMNRDNTIKATTIGSREVSMIVLMDLALQCIGSEADFLADWLEGMDAYYDENPSNRQASEIFAAPTGLVAASVKALEAALKQARPVMRS